MEWKWIKSLLIVVFIILNCFLLYEVYQKQQLTVINSENVSTIQNILESRNIKCSFEMDKVQFKNYMKKITISNTENIEPQFIYLNEISEQKDIFIGRNRRLLTFPIIITNFLRDTKLEHATIKDIKLGYYPEMSQIDKTVLSGEAIPAWRIVLETGEEYIYNAYLGERMSIIADDDM